MYKHIILLVLMLSSMTCRFYDREKLVDKEKLYGVDYRLFQQTPAWDLAKAVEDQNIKSIESNVRVKKIPVDFQEQRFGQTLLMLAIQNNHYESAKKLLELGANPNKKNNALAGYDTPMFDAAWAKDAKYLKLLLKYGGNPNAINGRKSTPLLKACVHPIHDSIDHVKALVEAGADVNYKTPYYGYTPLEEALVAEQMGVALYLLNKGADYRVVMGTAKGKKIYIENILRYRLFPLDSEQYRKKMKIVEFLKRKGINYRATPIPENMVEEIKRVYPNSWQEYLQKY